MWGGKKVVCIGSGPSVTKERLEAIRVARERDVCRVIVVNDMYLVAPWADVLYFADEKWWSWHVEGRMKIWPWVKFSVDEQKAALWSFKGQKVTIDHPVMAQHPSLFVLKKHGDLDFSPEQDAIRTGGNSGYQALNIAALSGGNPILLIGYDMRWSGGRRHSHNGHQPNDGAAEQQYASFAQAFDSTKGYLQVRGIEVINCTPNSLLRAYRFGQLESLLSTAA